MNYWEDVRQIKDLLDRTLDPYASDEEILWQIRSKVEMMLGCPNCSGIQMYFKSGCMVCPECGWSRR